MPEPSAPTHSAAAVRRARTAVAITFATAGIVIATWMSRIPQVRDDLGLTPGELGRVLLALALGSVLSLPTAGLLTNRIGAARAAATGAALTGCGLLLAGLAGGPFTSVPGVAVGLFALGFGAGILDVSMNVEGAAVERQIGRSLMPRLHAGFSVGTVAGATIGAGAAWAQVSVGWHLSVAGLGATAVAIAATRRYLPAVAADDEIAGTGTARDSRAALWRAWREPRTLLVGLLILTFAFSEGTAYDWLAVGLVDGLGVSNAIGAVGFAVFVSAMTVARGLGTTLLDRYGRVRVLRVSVLLVIIGVTLVVVSPSLPVALVGAVAWGCGTALGFPVGMSAAADDPRRAAVRVSVVASVAYTAFLAGPPLLGALGDQFGVQQALLVVVGVISVGVVAAAATRPLDPAPVAPARTSAADPG